MVSVIIPNYNHERYLKQRIESIINQTYKNIEIIILDDDSTDNSKNIIEKYRYHPKVKNIIYNKQNSGNPFIQWSKGFTLAQGEYIWIAESDDSAESDFLENLLNNFKNDNKISLAISGIKFIDEDNNQINRYTPINYIKDGTYDGTDFIKKYMINDNSIQNASSVVFKKELLANISNNYKKLKTAGDYLFWIELLRQCKISIYNKELDICRILPTSVTRRAHKSGQKYLELYEIYTVLKKYGLINKKTKLLLIARRTFILKKVKKNISNEIIDETLHNWLRESRLAIIYYYIYYVFTIIRKLIKIKI